MYRYLFLFICVLAYFGCQQKMKRSFLLSYPTEFQNGIPVSYDNPSDNPCKELFNYLPDTLNPDHTPLKYIKVNFHIVNNTARTANFDEKTGVTFINEVMKCANSKLGRNKPMHLPLDNNTPLIPMRYRYELTPDPKRPGDDGIYFHYDDDMYYVMNNGPNKNNGDRKVYEKYGIQKDTVMNIFVLDFPKDSALAATYNFNSNGVAFGSWVKVIGWHHDVQDTIMEPNGKRWKTPRGKWYAQKNLNHEIGHNLGLSHSWTRNDGCDDTPPHPNCFGGTKEGPCKEQWSNNFMDYNVYSSSWSPCQISKAHQNMMGMGRKKKLREMIKKTWCELDPINKIIIKDDVAWNGAKDMESHIEIRKGGSLSIRCKVSLPKGAKISVYPGGKLILDGAHLYNDCGEQWEGIEILTAGDKKGEVVYGSYGAEILDVVNGDFEIEE
jgi:hypothetical protein